MKRFLLCMAMLVMLCVTASAASEGDSLSYYSFDDVLSERESAYSGVIVEEGEDDITRFWDILAQYSLTNTYNVSVDTEVYPLEEMSAQRVAKVAIVDSVLGTDSGAFSTLSSWVREDGSITNPNILNSEGQPVVPYANEQVFCILALEIGDVEYSSEKAFEYLYSLQNSDGGFGFGKWSDVSTTVWVMQAMEISGRGSGEVYESASEYVVNSWEAALEKNDSNTMGSVVSSGLASEEMVGSFLEKSYTGSGFSWGSSSDNNPMATSQCSQALGDYKYGQTYKRLDDKFTVTVVDPEEPTNPDPEEPTNPDPEEPGSGSSSDDDDIVVTVRVDVPNFDSSCEVSVPDGSSAFDAFVKFTDMEGISYEGSSSYVSAVVVDGEVYGYGYAGNGLDGIMYTVNNETPVVGMGTYYLDSGDYVEVFYVYDYTTGDRDIPSEPGTGGESGVGGDSTAVKPPVESNNREFEDTDNHWAEEYISKVVELGYMSGVSESQFSPDTYVSRAQASQVLYNLFGSGEYEPDFEDVEEGSWYFNSIGWAQSAGVLYGYNGMAMPNDNVTREQFCVMLDRVLNFEGSSGDFKDEDSIADYASSSVDGAVASGVFCGNDGFFMPKSPLTRAQLAVVVCRLVDMEVVK